MDKNKEFHKRLNKLKDMWLKEFNLKDLDCVYIPNIPQEVKEYIGGQDMKITQGNFLKLLLNNREYMIPFIKPTIEKPNIALDDAQGTLFIKEFIDKDKNRYFMSVAKKYNGDWIFTSHTKRSFENIQNKIKHSQIIYKGGLERSEVAGVSDILESGGEVSKPSDLQIEYTANQDFGTNPTEIISQNPQESYIIPTQRDINELFKQDSSSNLSLEQRLSLLQENQSKLESMPKASNIIQHTTESLQRESQNNTDTQQSTHTAQNGADTKSLRRLK